MTNQKDKDHEAETRENPFQQSPVKTRMGALLGEKLQAVGDHLKRANVIAVLPHMNVDGDALGAALALALGLVSAGKEVDVLLEEPVPKSLDFLPGQDLVKVAVREAYDIALNIDNGDLARLGRREPVYWRSGMRLSIDHHATNKVEADVSHVDITASATGEIVFDLLNYMGIPLTKDIAICLYTAILTDTGGFRFKNTSPTTHRIAAELMAFGIDCGYAAKRVFDTVSMSKLQMMKQVMNHLDIYENGLLAVSYLTKEDIDTAGGNPDDFEGMVNIGRNVEGVEISLFVREEANGLLKGSLRSNDCVDVARIAETVGGGGHVRASGFSIEAPLMETLQDMRAKIVDAMMDCHFI